MAGFIAHFDTARDYPLQVAVAHTLVSTVTSSLSLLGSGFKQRTFPFLWVRELSPASATSFSQQQLTTTEPGSYLTSSLTHQPTHRLTHLRTD
jgi:hypothetical protein